MRKVATASFWIREPSHPNRVLPTLAEVVQKKNRRPIYLIYLIERRAILGLHCWLRKTNPDCLGISSPCHPAPATTFPQWAQSRRPPPSSLSRRFRWWCFCWIPHLWHRMMRRRSPPRWKEETTRFYHCHTLGTRHVAGSILAAPASCHLWRGSLGVQPQQALPASPTPQPQHNHSNLKTFQQLHNMAKVFLWY